MEAENYKSKKILRVVANLFILIFCLLMFLKFLFD